MSTKANQPKIVNTLCAELSKSRLCVCLHSAETLLNSSIEITRQWLELSDGEGL